MHTDPTLHVHEQANSGIVPNFTIALPLGRAVTGELNDGKTSRKQDRRDNG